MTVISPAPTPRLQVYLAWVHTWLHYSSSGDHDETPPFSIDTISSLFQDAAALCQSQDPTVLVDLVTSFQRRFKNGEITLGATIPPSCAETNLLSEKYDTRVDCSFDGISPMSSIKDADLTKAKDCRSVEKMLSAQQDVTERYQEWNGHSLFTVKKLRAAVEETIFCNFGILEPPTTCSGASVASLPPVKAPDRRPNAKCDSNLQTYNSLYPTFEEIKLCADAKHFYAMACGGPLVDEGILRAIADAGNDVLIGDYGEAAPPKILLLLQKTGAAAVAFLKACNLAGIVSDWQLEILVACHLQFRVLEYYRNHAKPKLPHGFRTIAASLATGQEINEAEYTKLSYGTTLINDLVDFRSDTMRNQRENPILRGVQGSLCEYMNKQMLDCLVSVTELIESKQILAMVTMAFCSWTAMASHHKFYEIIHGTREDTTAIPCCYDGIDEQYDLLLRALEPYGSLGPDGPHSDLKRVELDKRYSVFRQSPETHSAWMADSVRLLLRPSNFRRLVDVVHYFWTGDTGEVEYCP